MTVEHLRAFEHFMYFYIGPAVMFCILAAVGYGIYIAVRGDQ